MGTLNPECTCSTSVLTYDGPDHECPEHGQCAAWGHPLDGGTACHCGAVTPEIVPKKPEPTKLPPVPAPKAGDYLTTEQMSAWLQELTVKQVQQVLSAKGALPPGAYLAYGDQPVDTPLTSTDASEDPANAPCRVFWNAHGCGKPRIHVLPGHPAGPDHECGWGEPGGLCTRVSADGTGQWWYDDAIHQWVELMGKPWPVHGEDAPS